MTERERLFSVLTGNKVDRPPVICPGGMMTMASVEVMEKAGCAWPHAHRNPEKMANLSMAMHDEAGFENVGIPFCMTVESEAWGGEIEDGDKVTEPSIVNYPMHDITDWRGLKELDPLKDGRLPTIVECTRILKEKKPDIPVIANLVGPISLASSLIDAVTLFKALKKTPAEVHLMLDFLAENSIRYGEALLENGADVVVIADPSATGEILGPRMFAEFAFPYLNKMISRIKEISRPVPVIVHICGDIHVIYGPLNLLKADCISIDSLVSVKDAKAALPSKKIMGNVSTLLLQQGPVSKIRHVSDMVIDSGVDILAPACGISARTPLINIQAMSEAVRCHARGG